MSAPLRRDMLARVTRVKHPRRRRAPPAARAESSALRLASASALARVSAVLALASISRTLASSSATLRSSSLAVAARSRAADPITLMRSVVWPQSTTELTAAGAAATDLLVGCPRNQFDIATPPSPLSSSLPSLGCLLRSVFGVLHDHDDCPTPCSQGTSKPIRTTGCSPRFSRGFTRSLESVEHT